MVSASNSPSAVLNPAADKSLAKALSLTRPPEIETEELPPGLRTPRSVAAWLASNTLPPNKNCTKPWLTKEDAAVLAASPAAST